MIDLLGDHTVQTNNNNKKNSCSVSDKMLPDGEIKSCWNSPAGLYCTQLH